MGFNARKEGDLMRVRKYQMRDTDAMMAIWNGVVEEGNAFPQEEPLDASDTQSYCGVAVDFAANVHGLYILHPNNEGRCGHICNASFAVAPDSRGQKVGEDLVKDCIVQAGKLGFKILQFNAVVTSNEAANKLYEKLGFNRLGTIPGGFRLKDGSFADINLYYINL